MSAGESAGTTASKGIALVREELARMLENEVLPLEAGLCVLPDGMRMVASLHHVPRVTGAMIAWWLDRAWSPEEFHRWHPRDHVRAERDESRDASIVSHVFDGRIETMKIQRRDPADYFGGRRLAPGLTAICSRGGPAHQDVWGVHLIHLCQDTDWGCRVRSRMFLGDFEPEPPADLRPVLVQAVSDAPAARVLRHQCEEFVHLASFLPALHAREHA
jgi:hypothetical protein